MNYFKFKDLSAMYKQRSYRSTNGKYCLRGQSIPIANGIISERSLFSYRRDIGVRVIFGQGGRQTICPKNSCKLPKFLQNSRKETRAIRCNNIGPRTGIRKCLNTGFQGQYIPAKFEHKLYVAINKHLEKFAPQLYQIILVFRVNIYLPSLSTNYTLP